MLRIVFMGTPEFAVPTLSEIVANGYDVVAVYTQPPRASGRGMNARRSPVHRLAEQSGLEVHTPRSLKGTETQQILASHKANVGVVVAFGLLLPGPVLEAPEHGWLNLHPSLLPRWRGAAPLQRTLMAGDTETGVMVMRMDEGLDTGPVCLGERIPLSPDITAGELHDLAARRGADLMVRALAALSRGTLDCKPQPETGVTYAEKIEKAEARIDWSRPAAEIHNRIRGLSPSPGAWFEIARDGVSERVKALRSTLAEGAGEPGRILDDHMTVACGEGAVRLVELQRAGKKAVDGEAFLRGAHLAADTRVD